MAGHGRLWNWWNPRERILREAAKREEAERLAAVRRILNVAAGARR